MLRGPVRVRSQANYYFQHACERSIIVYRASAINFMLLLLSRRSQARNRKNANSPLPSGEFYAHVRRIIEMREYSQVKKLAS